MKKEFQEPEIEVIEIEQDVICTSECSCGEQTTYNSFPF